MKRAYGLFLRKGWYYSEHFSTGKQTSLRTKDRTEAERFLAAKNDAANSSAFATELGRIYMGAADPQATSRTWADVISVATKRGRESTRSRAERAYASRDFDGIREKPVIETQAGDFMLAMGGGRSATVHYLKMLHSLAMEMGWLGGRHVLPPRAWPKIKPAKPRRGITEEEHARLLASERCPERLAYYSLLWEIGASQWDAANLSASNVNWQARTLVYFRQKTGEQACLRIGGRLEAIIRQLPGGRWWFPMLSQWSSERRSIEFHRRCKVANVFGVSLHSYRYAWAERAYAAGYPERYAQAALGHSSNAVHHAYAKGAKVLCPPLEDYEGKIVPLMAQAEGWATPVSGHPAPGPAHTLPVSAPVPSSPV